MMKTYSKIIIAIFALSIISNAGYAQKKNYVPEKGYWVMVSNVHEKKNTEVQFYDDNSNLIYQETITGVRLNVKRKKTLMFLKSGLEKAMIAWNENKEVMKNRNWLAVMIKEKR